MQLTHAHDRVPTPARRNYLGPAEVIEVAGAEITVRIGPDREVPAALALAYPYQPAVGDLLLVIGEDDHYVIGVLHGRGTAELAFNSDVTLRALDGRLDLVGDRGVRIQGPELEIRTGMLRMLADRVYQNYNQMTQRVRKLFSFRAGTAHSSVDGTSLSKARTTKILSEEKVSINGRQIHLG